MTKLRIRSSRALLAKMRSSLLVLGAFLSVASGCGDKKKSEKPPAPLPTAGELRKMPSEKACAVVFSQMLSCQTEFVRTVRTGMTAQGATEQAIEAGKFFEKRLAKGSSFFCGDVSKEELDLAVNCFRADCNEFAGCLVQTNRHASPAIGQNVPTCPEGGSAYESTNEDGMRAIWCIRPDGTPHGPWVVWDQGGTKRIEGAYEEGQKTGTWQFFHDDGTETQTWDSGERKP